MSQSSFAIKTYTETDDGFPGTFSLILSDDTLDRDGEVVDLKCFTASKSLPERISMDVDHRLTVESTVASGVPSYAPNGALQIDGTWSSIKSAQDVRTLVREGHIMYTSVAYKTVKSLKDAKGVRHIVDAELLNGTFTQIPANPNAKVISAKAGARNSKTDASHIQAAHDSTVSAGATCATSKAHLPDGFKAIVGSVEALQERVADALEDAYPPSSDLGWGYSQVIGVLPDTVIFSVCGSDALESDETYRQTFTDDGALVTLTGTPEIVDIAEIVTPDADAAREATAETPGATVAKTAAPTVDAAAALRMRARVLALTALARAT